MSNKTIGGWDATATIEKWECVIGPNGVGINFTVTVLGDFLILSLKYNRDNEEIYKGYGGGVLPYKYNSYTA